MNAQRMSRLTRELAGQEVSPSTVSRITERLQERVEQLRSARIEVPEYDYDRWVRSLEKKLKRSL